MNYFFFLFFLEQIFHEVTRTFLNNGSVYFLKLLKNTLRLTLVAQRPPEARETITLSCDVVTRSVAVDTLRTRLAAAVAEVAWRANCRGHKHRDSCSH